ncbi:hypothetical protein V8B97DRAFT_1916851 [Scleroderma yunnanense]
MPHSLISSAGVSVSHLSPGDDEDNDICPVCDGDCTCNNKPHLPTPIASCGSAHYVTIATGSTNSSEHAPGTQPLKIKLTVPPSMQNKVRSLAAPPKRHHADGISASSNGAAESISVSPFSSSGQSHRTGTSGTVGHGYRHALESSTPKKRGRPSKGIPRELSDLSVSDRLLRCNEASTLSQSQSHHYSHSSRSSGPKAFRSLVKGGGHQKSNIKTSRQVPKSQARGTITKKTKKRAYISHDTEPDHDLDDQSVDTTLDEDDEDRSSGHFPTFLPADDLVSTASESSESDLESTGFGSDSSLEAEEENYILAEQRRRDKARVRRELLGDDGFKRKDAHNSWVIRPRKRSVGISDVEMDGDTDNVTEEEEEEEEMNDDEEEDETDGQVSRPMYTGVATGWSDDEESSFDADLFFANLSDTNTDGSSSDEGGTPQIPDPVIDVTTDSISSLPRSVDFEVTEAWDGQLVFTNGSNEGHGVLDAAFEATAAQLPASDSTSVDFDSDVEMRTSDGDGDEDESEFGESDGDTTEEELVDERGLPTPRAMRLFRWPTNVSAINPLSTVSPSCSPAPNNCRSPASASQLPLESPKPADILAGKVFFDVPDDRSQDSAEGIMGSPRVISRGGVPVMGQFNLDTHTPLMATVLTGMNKDVPSPFPRLGHRRRRHGSSSCGSFSSDLRDRTTKLSLYTPSSLPPPSDEPSSEAAADVSLGVPIQLHDVLDTTFIDSEPEAQAQTTSCSEGGMQKHVQSLNRWDRVPVSAFRLTREPVASDIPTSPGWTSEPSKSVVSDILSYEQVLRNTPLGTMLWQDKGVAKPASRRSKTIVDIVISPVILPVRDGDRTPPRLPNYDNRNQQQNHKTRKESRREMKMLKRKGRSPVQHHYYHQKHFRHNHHPNTKSRSTGSLQRNFHGSPTAIPTLNI